MVSKNSSTLPDVSSTASSSLSVGSSDQDPTGAKTQPPDSQSVSEGRDDSKLLAISVREKITVELYEPPEPDSKSARLGKFLKDAGPLVTTFTGLFTLIVSFLVFTYGHQINLKQTEINERQTGLKERELEVAQADLRVKQAELQAKQSDLRQKVFAELNQPQETSRTLAAIRLAEYGEEILDPIRMALGVEQEKIQAGAVKVVFHIFRSETVPRERVFSKLKEFMAARNPHLRKGALDCLIEICEELSDDQKRQAIELLKKRLGSQAERCGEENETVVLEVAKFFGNCPSNDSVDFLLGVIKNCPYGDPRNQAALHLCKVVIGFPVEMRNSVIAKLEGLLNSGTVFGDLAVDIETAIKRIRAVKCL